MSANVTAFDLLKLELKKDTPQLVNDRPDFEKVRQIISANKHLLNEPIDDNGENVLHYACWKEAPSNIVIEFINGSTLAVQQKNNYGEYPLHSACRFNQSESVIQLLVKEYPLAVQLKDRYGKYPLHLACENNQSELVIQLLVKEYPLALQQKNYYGQYPLELAIRSSKSENVVLKLIELFPEATACGIYDHYHKDDGYLLHLACLYIQSEAVIQLLVKEYPLAVQHKDYYGYYPLHLALFHKQCENVVLKLIELYPEANACRFDDLYSYRGQTGYPLHLACRYNQSERVLLVLIHLSLHAVKHKDCNDKTPLCIAKQCNQSSTIINVLKELTTMSDYDLENRKGIPTIVTLHGLDNLRRNDIYQWVLYNSPILIDGEYIYIFRNA